MKLLITVALTLLAAYAVCTYAQSRNATWGQISYNNILLARNLVAQGSKVAQVVTANYTYPTKGAVSKYRISGIRAIDNNRNGTASYLAIAAGGPGYNYTTVNFRSQRGFGLNYTVEVYGY